MRKTKYRRMLLLMWLITPLFSASAQTDSQDSAEAKKVCVFPSADLTEAETTRDYKNIISGIIESEFENAGFTIIPRDEWTGVRRELVLTYNIGSLSPESDDRRRVAPGDYWPRLVRITVPTM